MKKKHSSKRLDLTEIGKVIVGAALLAKDAVTDAVRGMRKKAAAPKKSAAKKSGKAKAKTKPAAKSPTKKTVISKRATGTRPKGKR